jgi:hypothetical protein
MTEENNSEDRVIAVRALRMTDGEPSLRPKSIRLIAAC